MKKYKQLGLWFFVNCVTTFWAIWGLTHPTKLFSYIATGYTAFLFIASLFIFIGVYLIIRGHHLGTSEVAVKLFRDLYNGSALTKTPWMQLNFVWDVGIACLMVFIPNFLVGTLFYIGQIILTFLTTRIILSIHNVYPLDN